MWTTSSKYETKYKSYKKRSKQPANRCLLIQQTLKASETAEQKEGLKKKF